MKIARVFLALSVAVTMSACSTMQIGGTTLSGKDTIKIINGARNITMITKPGVIEELNTGVKNVFGYHRNVR